MAPPSVPSRSSRWPSACVLLALALFAVPAAGDPSAEKGHGVAGDRRRAPSGRAAEPAAPAVLAGDRVIVGPERAVDDGRATTPHVEPYLAAHPDDPAHLAGVATLVEDGSWRNAAFVSFDAGETWSRADLPGCEGDPWAAFGPGDDVFASCLMDRPVAGDETVITTGLYRSGDGGRTWSGPAAMPLGRRGGSSDHPTLVVDRRAVPAVYLTQGQWLQVPERRGRFYVPSLSRSDDGGRSLGEPVFLAHDNLHQQPLDAGLLSDGTLAILFQDYMVGGRLLAHRRTWLTLSPDRGESLLPPTLVYEQTASEMPWGMAVDPSGGRRDRIYVVIDGSWSRSGSAPEAGSGGSSAILVIRSDDRGETWSPPVPASDAAPGIERGIPAIAVNRQGVVGVAWYDRRRDPDGGCFDLFFAASVDGGDRFLPEVRITPEMSCPDDGPHPGVARRFPLGGDYSGLAAAADGSFHLLWADARTGTYQLRTARTEVERAEHAGDAAAGGT